MSALKKPPSRFEYGGYYLDNPHPERGGGWYACRYDPEKRSVTRRSLKTADFEEAKTKLITLTELAPPPDGGPPGPKQVKITTVMDAYVEARASKIRSAEVAQRVRALVTDYLAERGMLDATVSAWTPSRQLKFAEWLTDTFKHSPSTVQRYLTLQLRFSEMSLASSGLMSTSPA